MALIVASMPNSQRQTDKKPQVDNRSRRHFIPEWAEEIGMTQADIVRATGVDKGLVSRWFSGTLPTEGNMEKLARALGTVPIRLLKHPDEVWVADFLDGRDHAEREHIKKAMEFNWPRPSKQ